MSTTEEFMASRPEGGRPPHLVRKVIARAFRRLRQDRCLGLAAEAGFWALLSLPSLILAVFSLLGYFNGVLGRSNVTKIRNDILRVSGDVLTSNTVRTSIDPIVRQVLDRGHFEILSISFVIALWSGSTVMSDYVNVITVAYDMRGLRSAWRSRLLALGLYLLAVLAGLVLLPALALGPDLIVSLFPDSVAREISLTIHILYWPVVGLGSVVVLTTMYKLCLPVRVRWRRNLPGAVFAMVGWLAGSFGVRTYLESSFRSKSSASLAAPIATLLFFYVTALAVIVGAELNSAIDALWPVPSTASGRAQSVRKAREVAHRKPIGLGDPTIGDTWGELPPDVPHADTG